MANHEIDAVDKTILRHLHDDSRTSPSSIAETMEHSTEEVAERIQHLEEAGVISKYTIMVDPAELGYISVAFGFSVQPGRTDEIAAELSNYEYIYKLWILSGRHNIVAHASFEDIGEFQTFSHDTLHDIDGISNYETSIMTKSILNEGGVILPDD